MDYHIYMDLPTAWTGGERWYPLAAEKKNMGATLERYGTEEYHDDERDWNLMLRLLPPFSYMWDLATAYSEKDMSQWWACYGEAGTNEEGDECLFGEVTPDHPFYYNNRWLQPSPDNHFSVPVTMERLDTVGVYGVFVRDVNHGSNPEIHPMQQFWYKDHAKEGSAVNSFWLFFVQDRSNRFWQTGNVYFNDAALGNHPPADSLEKYRPWALSPVYGNYLIAFHVTAEQFKGVAGPLGSPLTINLTVEATKEVVTKEHADQWRDADDGISHSLVIGTDKVVTVNEPEKNDNDLGIRFTDVTRLPDGTYEGYVEISMVIGDFEGEGTGYMVLHADIIPPQGSLKETE